MKNTPAFPQASPEMCMQGQSYEDTQGITGFLPTKTVELL